MFRRISTATGIFLFTLLFMATGYFLQPLMAKAAAKETFKMPDPIVLSTLDVGGGGYIIGAAVSASMKQEKNITMRVLPCGTDASRLSVLHIGRAHIAAMGIGVYLAQEGVYDFGTRDWGPQPIRMVLTNWAKSGAIYMTARDADIKTWADAKGKRFTWIPGYFAANVVGTAMLAFGGLTWNDVVKVEVPSFASGGQAVIDGKADAACCMTYAAFNYALEASPRGLYYPPLPHRDAAGWARLMNVCPYYAKMMCTEGAGLSETKSYEGGTYPNNNITVYAKANPDLVYQITKLYVELYPVYIKSKAPGINGYSLDLVKNYLSWAVPFHEGAIRYFKEVGVWTAENEANNRKLIHRQHVLQTAWDDALAQSADQKIPEKNFQKFWMTLRQKALEKPGLPVVFYPE
jgi:TRAP transporter TAXI family solute receptor